MNQFLAFLNLYQHAKNQLIPSVYFWDTVSLKFPWPDWPHSFLTMPTQKCFDQLLIFFNLYQNANNQLFHLFILQIHSFLTKPTPKIFKHILICINLYQHLKNQSIPSVHSSDKVSFRDQRLDWPHPFLTMLNQKVCNQLFNFIEFLSMYKKWGCFIKLFWRNNGFKNPAIWLADSILAYNSGIRFFPI